ncbi:MAG: MoxR family ATPase, partial [Moorea sp. SIO4G2]|nr:MoxR family ATPase [Moorena sp. SIO4G2]
FKPEPYAVTKLQQDNTIPYRDLVFKLRQDWQNPNYAP